MTDDRQPLIAWLLALCDSLPRMRNKELDVFLSLAYLDAHPGAKVGELQGNLQCAPAHMSRVMRKMQHDHLVTVAINLDDGRSRSVRLTAEGRATLAAMRGKREAALKKALESQPTPAVEKLVEAMSAEQQEVLR